METISREFVTGGILVAIPRTRRAFNRGLCTRYRQETDPLQRVADPLPESATMTTTRKYRFEIIFPVRELPEPDPSRSPATMITRTPQALRSARTSQERERHGDFPNLAPMSRSRAPGHPRGSRQTRRRRTAKEFSACMMCIGRVPVGPATSGSRASLFCPSSGVRSLGFPDAPCKRFRRDRLWSADVSLRYSRTMYSHSRPASATPRFPWARTGGDRVSRGFHNVER